jgi:quercetin dioxygenase-like cupin family protein
MEITMRNTAFVCGLSAALLAGISVGGLAETPNKPVQVMQASVKGMPTEAVQEIKVMSATMQPGEKSVRHTHGFPVTLYVIEGELQLDIAGQASVTAKAGEAVIEQANLDTTASNPSASKVTKLIMFYASKPQTPFLVPLN